MFVLCGMNDFGWGPSNSAIMRVIKKQYYKSGFKQKKKKKNFCVTCILVLQLIIFKAASTSEIDVILVSPTRNQPDLPPGYG